MEHHAGKNVSVISTGSAAMHREHMHGSCRAWATAVLLESFAKVQAMQENLPDLVVVASHDTTAASKLAAARGSAPVTSSDRVAVS